MPTNWNIALAILTVVDLALVSGVVIFAIARDSESSSRVRYCVITNDLLGYIGTDLNSRVLSWSLHHPFPSVVQLYLNQTNSSSILSLCGPPSMLACNAGSLLEGSIGSEVSLKTTIRAIQAEPFLYELTLEPGNVRVRLGPICGGGGIL
jgi:hypothetical protein